MALKLYFDLLSQPSRALYILLKASKVPFIPCPVALRKGEHLTEEYKSISRFQKVPAIQDGDFALSESIAILRYLARQNNALEQWYPNNNQVRAKVDEYLEWQHNNIRTHGSLYFRVKCIDPILTGQPPNQKRVTEYEERMVNSMDSFEEFFLKETPYIVGNSITAADLWAACEVEQPRIGGYDVEANRPRLKSWLNNIRKTLNPHYEEAHVVLNKWASKASKSQT